MTTLAEHARVWRNASKELMAFSEYHEDPEDADGNLICYALGIFCDVMSRSYESLAKEQEEQDG